MPLGPYTLEATEPGFQFQHSAFQLLGLRQLISFLWDKYHHCSRSQFSQV